MAVRPATIVVTNTTFPLSLNENGDRMRKVFVVAVNVVVRDAKKSELLLLTPDALIVKTEIIYI